MVHFDDVRAIKEKILAYDLNAVTARYAKKEGVDLDRAKKLEMETKKFLYLNRLHKVGYAISGECDEYWHDLILDTQTYTAFCDECFGRYIHHRPSDGDDKSAMTLRYYRFLIDYFREFQEAPPENIWPHSNQLFGGDPVFETAGECIAPCSDIGCQSPK